MILTKCPLRISLVGGSTDNPKFLEKYGSGEVISFPSNLYCYATIHRDINGINANGGKFIVNYSVREECNSVEDIKNDIVREVLKYFNCWTPLTISLTSDISSSGSGLASSSAYVMALVAGMCKFKNLNVTDDMICETACEIERCINPLVGLQDFYGSITGGLKRITFKSIYDDYIRTSVSTYTNFRILECNPLFLIHTGVQRASTDVLKTLNLQKCKELLKDVESLDRAITEDNYDNFIDTITQSWENKKKTSKDINKNRNVQKIDKFLNDLGYPHKLCGAGNGGYFFVIGDRSFRNKYTLTNNLIEIKINEKGSEIFNV